MIKMYDVWKRYPNDVIALNGFNVNINRGDFVYLVGPSGAGKSTFIKLIYREERPSKGQIFVDGMNLDRIKSKRVAQLRRNIGIVFQDYRLLPTLTVSENIAFAMEVLEKTPEEIKREVPDVLDMVGLRGKEKSFPNQLSGGEQQRVAIARALINRPAVLIADEPTGNLDPLNAWEIMNVLERINLNGTTIVMATHNKEIVNRMKKRVIEIDRGQVVRDEVKGGYDNA